MTSISLVPQEKLPSRLLLMGAYESCYRAPRGAPTDAPTDLLIKVPTLLLMKAASALTRRAAVLIIVCL